LNEEIEDLTGKLDKEKKKTASLEEQLRKAKQVTPSTLPALEEKN